MRHSLMAAAMAATLLPGPALACAVTHLLTPERAEAADFVLAGRLVSYQPNIWDSFPKEPRYALVRLQVTDVWKGAVGEEFEFLLTDDEMPLMRDWQWPDEIIIAAMDPGKPGAPLRESLPKVHQRICSMAFAPVTDQTLGEYRAWFGKAD